VSLTIVNGYLCFSSCDAAKAATGQDPHPKSQQPGATTTPTAGGVQNPAVTYGGSLAGRNALAGVVASQQAAATGGNPAANAVDLRA
jgi:hypothetical protein